MTYFAPSIGLLFGVMLLWPVFEWDRRRRKRLYDERFEKGEGYEP